MTPTQKAAQTASHPAYHVGDQAPVTPEIRFGDPVQVIIGDLAVGDFLVSVPTQGQVQGCKVNSGIKALTEDYTTWYTRVGRKGRIPMNAHVVEFLGSDLPALIIPDHFICIVRHQEVSQTNSWEIISTSPDDTPTCPQHFEEQPCTHPAHQASTEAEEEAERQSPAAWADFYAGQCECCTTYPQAHNNRPCSVCGHLTGSQS